MRGDRYRLVTVRELAALEEAHLIGKRLVAVHAHGKGDEFKLVLIELEKAVNDVDKLRKEMGG